MGVVPHRSSLVALIVATAAAFGCSDDAPVTDASADAPTDGAPPDAVVREVVPDPPEAPALPTLTPCPDGWSEVDVVGTTACEPWSAEDGPGCGDGEVRFVGESCAPLGPACPADGVPTDLPPGPVLHVRAGSAMGDGSPAAPFGSIGEALEVATASDVIAVHAGTYPEAVLLPDGVSMIGACVAETVIDAPDGTPGDAAVFTNGDVSLARFTIRGGRPGLHAQRAGVARVEDVWIEASYIGVVVTAMGTVVADGLVVRDIAPGTELGYGAFVTAGATFEARRADFLRVSGFGLAVGGASAEALLDGVAFRDVRPTAEGGLGTAIAVQGGSTVTVRNSLIEGAVASGAFVHQSAEIQIEDSLIRDVVPSIGDDGFGITTVTRGILNASRTRVVNATGSGLVSIGYGTSITANDVVTHEIQPGLGEGGGAGAGAFADTGAVLHVDRFLVHRAAGLGISLTGPELDVLVRDVTILDTRLDGDAGVSGVGLDVRNGGAGTFERVRIDGAIGGGLVASGDGVRLDITDLSIASTTPIPEGDMFGRGASIQLGAELSCLRCALRDTIEAGVLLHDADATFSHLSVQDTGASGSSGAGMGLVAVAAAQARIEDFLIQRNAVAGVQIADGAELTLVNGVIADNPVGVNVQNAPVDHSALTDGVVYRDNGQNLDSTDLPVPGAAPF